MTAGDLVMNMSLNSAGFRRGVQNAQQDLGMLAKSVGQVKTVLAGFLTAGAIRSAFGTLTGTIHELDDLAASADRLGVSTEFLSELQHAARLSDTDIGDLNQSLRLFEKNLGNAALEGGSVAEMLQRAGLNAAILAEMGPERAFLEIADAASRISDPLQRAAFATEIFGRGGQNIINLLARGKAGIQAFREEARQLGVSLSSEAAASISEADDSLKRFDASMQGIKNTIAIELSPSLKTLTAESTNFAKEFKDVVAPAINAVVDAFTKAREGARLLGDVLGGIFGGSSIKDAIHDAEIGRQGRAREAAAAALTTPAVPPAGANIDLGNKIGDAIKQAIPQLSNPAQLLGSREAFTTIARSLTQPAINVAQQQLGEAKKGNGILERIAGALNAHDEPEVAPDF